MTFPGKLKFKRNGCFLVVLAGFVLSGAVLSGCSQKSLIYEIPLVEFKKFEYHRAGNFSSAHITAENSSINDEAVQIEKLSIQADYGPVVNFNITIEGYQRELTPSERKINE